MQALPPLRPLCLVLKIFLQQRELNEVYQGGIGSYALLVMLLAHLQVLNLTSSLSIPRFQILGVSCFLSSNLLFMARFH
jgi:non-canonical poly(A) RNA polymerase PAPD5/7